MLLLALFVATRQLSQTNDEIQPNGTYIENQHILFSHNPHRSHICFCLQQYKTTQHNTTGYLVTYAGVRFPGAENIPAGFAALDALPGQVVAQMGFTLFLMEAANSPTPGTYNNFKPEFQGGEFIRVKFPLLLALFVATENESMYAYVSK